MFTNLFHYLPGTRVCWNEVVDAKRGHRDIKRHAESRKCREESQLTFSGLHVEQYQGWQGEARQSKAVWGP